MLALVGCAAMLVAAGCSGTPDSHAAEDPTPTKSPTPMMSTATPVPAASMRFSYRSFACSPKQHSQVKGTWETRAPRFQVKPRSVVTLALRNVDGTGKQPVIASVYSRTGGHAFAGAILNGRHWAVVHFPLSFRTAGRHRRVRAYAPGTLTVVWVTAGGHKFISCDGFATYGASRHHASHGHSAHHQ